MAYRRVLRRARNEEATVDLSYLQQIHQLHEEWIDQQMVANQAEESDIPVSTSLSTESLKANRNPSLELHHCHSSANI